MTTTSPPLRPPPRWVTLTLAVLTVVAVAVISLLPFRDELTGADDDAPAVTATTVPPTADAFDRPDDTPLGPPWEVVSGTWVVQDEHAALTAGPADGGASVAVLTPGDTPAGPRTAAVTVLAVEPGWAFAFRVAGPDDQWRLVAHPETSSWSLEVVRAGVVEERPGFLPVAPADGDRIEVRMVGERVTVTVGATTAEVDDPVGADRTAVALVATTADGLASMAWDDVEVRAG